MKLQQLAIKLSRQTLLNALICFLFSLPAFAEKRVALIVGNSSYQNVARLPATLFV